MNRVGGLPGALTSRSLAEPDAEAAFTVVAADERAFLGRAEIEPDDVISDWQRPSYDVAANTVGVFDADQLVGYAALTAPDRAEVAVHPDWHGRGIGTAIADWVCDMARSRGWPLVGMPVPKGSPGDVLLTQLGWPVRWESWVLEVPEDGHVEPPQLPEGYVLRSADGTDDLRGAWTVLEDAFLEWSARDRQSFEDFLAATRDRPGAASWNVLLTIDPEDTVVGASHVTVSTGPDGAATAHVQRLAVRKDRRGSGLGRALLAESIAQARRHGASRCQLSTDSRTGALDLYLHVGMNVTQTWVNRAVAL